jgi:hypothetical protein
MGPGANKRLKVPTLDARHTTGYIFYLESHFNLRFENPNS